MVILKFRQLIDLAIGSPEPGHVNFFALHCLLSCIAEKLNILDDTIDCKKYGNTLLRSTVKPKKSLVRFKAGRQRLFAGADSEKDNELADEVINVESPEPAEGVDTEQESTEMQESQQLATESESAMNQVDTTDAEVIPPAVVELPAEEEIYIANEDLKTIEEPQFIQKTSKDNEFIKDGSKELIYELDRRILTLEDLVSSQNLTAEHLKGLSIMKQQIEAVMEQLLLFTFIVMDKPNDPERIKDLYGLTQTIRQIRKDNIYIDNPSSYILQPIPSLEWIEYTFHLHVRAEEPAHNDSKSKIVESADENEAQGNKYIEEHLCYSNEKILDQLLDLKAEFCLLINKVNEISVRILQQESHHTTTLIQELQEQVRDIKLVTTNLKVQQEDMDMRSKHNLQHIEEIKTTVMDLTSEKVDKTELEILLADKVDYNQLQRKVSLDQMLELQCRIDKKFYEMLRQIADNDKKVNLTIEHLRETLGYSAIEGILNTFRDQIENKINSLQDSLQNYIDSTNDESAAAGARVKVLQDLACLSCDTTCVMRTKEKAKVAKLPDAHATVVISPFITYELGSLRKSSVVGYHRKDEFPHAPNAWMGRQGIGLPMKNCVPRHAGGAHTTNTAKERVEKFSNTKK